MQKVGLIEVEYLINNPEITAASKKAEADITGVADSAQAAEKRVIDTARNLASSTSEVGKIVGSVGNDYRGLLEGGAIAFNELDAKTRVSTIQLVDMQQELKLVPAPKRFKRQFRKRQHIGH